MDVSNRFSVAETPTQRTFSTRRRRSYSHSALSASFRHLSFLSLTPSPEHDESFTNLIDLSPRGDCSPVFLGPRSPIHCLTPIPKAKPSFAFKKFSMPSWSLSSKSSKSTSATLEYPCKPAKASKPKSDKTYGYYLPQPFFNAVAEYQLINGGSEKSAIRAVLKERGLNMTVEEAKNAFGNESVAKGGNTVVNAGIYRDAQGVPWMDEEEEMEYSQLIPRFSDDEDTSSADSDEVGRFFRSSKTNAMGARRRPAPLQLRNAPHYGFEDSFAPPSSESCRSSMSTNAPSTLFTPSVVEPTKSSKGVKRIFKMGRK